MESPSQIHENQVCYTPGSVFSPIERERLSKFAVTIVLLFMDFHPRP
jgi:hypothetical protein